MLNLAILDAHTSQPGDLSWEDISCLGNLAVYDRTGPDQIVERLRDVHIAITNKVVLDRRVIEHTESLQCIVVLATGTNVVDGVAARERGIPVMNVPAYSTRSVAQMVWAHILSITQGVGDLAPRVRAGEWAAQSDFCFWDHALIELEGLTLGIVGYGQIGREVARVGRVFGMKVLFTARSPREPEAGFQQVPLETLLRKSDIISLHCPLTPETENLINAERLAMMKPDAILINTGRGPLVDEDALTGALKAGRLRAAGLDVLRREPPLADNPLTGLANCSITPHVAWATRAARARLIRQTAANIRGWIEGHAPNVVN